VRSRQRAACCSSEGRFASRSPPPDGPPRTKHRRRWSCRREGGVPRHSVPPAWRPAHSPGRRRPPPERPSRSCSGPRFGLGGRLRWTRRRRRRPRPQRRPRPHSPHRRPRPWHSRDSRTRSCRSSANCRARSFPWCRRYRWNRPRCHFRGSSVVVVVIVVVIVVPARAAVREEGLRKAGHALAARAGRA
jgi:hypothetical protein